MLACVFDKENIENFFSNEYSKKSPRICDVLARIGTIKPRQLSL